MTTTEVEDLTYEAAPEPLAQTKNLWQKLADVMLNVGYIQKRGKHPTQGFRYTQNIDIRKEIREELGSRNIVLLPSCTEATQQSIDRPTKSGPRTVTQTQLKLCYTFVNGDNPAEQHPCEWYGWSEGSEAYAAYGGMTGGQRHFLESAFLLLTGEIDPEKFNAEMEAEFEAEIVKTNTKKSDEIMRVVGTTGQLPTKEQMQEIEAKVIPPEGPEVWKDISVRMCQGLEERYPGKRVGDIHLKHLIGAQIFVKKVWGREKGFISPGHNQLADALARRLDWEIEAGHISKSQNLDGTNHYEVT